MSERLIFRPLRAYPHKQTPHHQRESWPSKVTLSKAAESLLQQLRLLGCDATAYIEADVEERHIRQDGQLYASARAKSPMVIVSARHRRLGDVRWANDRYQSFEENVRAIALTIQNLRAIERYGCVRDNEQFTGFKALPERASETLSRETAIAVLNRHASAPMADTTPSSMARAYRSARGRTHPDVNAGDATAFHAVEAAARVLGVTNAC